MIFKGICKNKGKYVTDDASFFYAASHIRELDQPDRFKVIEMMKSGCTMQDFVDFFFSGDWIEQNDEEMFFVR